MKEEQGKECVFVIYASFVGDVCIFICVCI